MLRFARVVRASWLPVPLSTAGGRATLVCILSVSKHTARSFRTAAGAAAARWKVSCALLRSPPPLPPSSYPRPRTDPAPQPGVYNICVDPYYNDPQRNITTGYTLSIKLAGVPVATYTGTTYDPTCTPCTPLLRGQKGPACLYTYTLA